MAVRRYKRTKRQAIYRQDLPGRNNTVTLDSRNNPIGSSIIDFTLKACTIQPASGDELKTLDEGYRDAELFTIFTETIVRTALRGTSQKADEVFISTPYTAVAGWFTVLKSKPWQNRIVPHYQILVVRKNPD
jgi:hypothetical protein